MTGDKFLRTPEAAKLLGVARRSLEKWRVYGTGPVFTKMGRLVMYAESDLDRWATSRRRRSTSDPGPEMEK